jgi:hypothetical protein
MDVGKKGNAARLSRREHVRNNEQSRVMADANSLILFRTFLSVLILCNSGKKWEISEVVRTRCSHIYCERGIAHFARNTLRQEYKFPSPRIPFTTKVKFLHSNIKCPSSYSSKRNASA